MLYGYKQSHYIHKTDDIYKDIAEVIEARFHTSSYELDKPLPQPKNKKQLD